MSFRGEHAAFVRELEKLSTLPSHILGGAALGAGAGYMAGGDASSALVGGAAGAGGGFAGERLMSHLIRKPTLRRLSSIVVEGGPEAAEKVRRLFTGHSIVTHGGAAAGGVGLGTLAGDAMGRSKEAGAGAKIREALVGAYNAVFPYAPPRIKKELLPESRISPVLILGPKGLRLRLRIGRRPEGVDPKSAVGVGLANQHPTTGAEVTVEES